MKKRQYKAEFKRDAAYQIIIKGVAVKELSDKLGVPVSLLYRWKSEQGWKWGHVVMFAIGGRSRAQFFISSGSRGFKINEYDT
jgi:uncharacterized protein YjcR